jgi:hypothetical protein
MYPLGLVLVVESEEASSGIIYLLLYKILHKLFVNTLRLANEIERSYQRENEKGNFGESNMTSPGMNLKSRF